MREASRSTWLKSVSRGMLVQFVMRGVGLREWSEALAEAERYGDLLFTEGDATMPSSFSESSRVSRGALLSQFLWLECAARAFASSAFIGTVDDDVWLHTPGMERMLDGIFAATPETSMYIGKMMAASWREDLELVTNVVGSSGRHVSNCSRNGPVLGPFNFATRASFVTSKLSSLVTTTSHKEHVLMMAYRTEDDEARKKQTQKEKQATRPDHVRGDTWLGLSLSKLHAGPSIHPIANIDLGWDHFQDRWGLKARRTTLIWCSAGIDQEFMRRVTFLQSWSEGNHCDNAPLVICNNTDILTPLSCSGEPWKKCELPSVDHWKELRTAGVTGWAAGYKCKTDLIDLFPQMMSSINDNKTSSP